MAEGAHGRRRQRFRGRREKFYAEPGIPAVRRAVLFNKGQSLPLAINIIVGADNGFAGYGLVIYFPIGGAGGRCHPVGIQRPRRQEGIVVKAAPVRRVKGQVRLTALRLKNQFIIGAATAARRMQTPGRQNVPIPPQGCHHQSLVGMAFQQMPQPLPIDQVPGIHRILRPQIFRGSPIHQEIEIAVLQGMELHHLQGNQPQP